MTVDLQTLLDAVDTEEAQEDYAEKMAEHVVGIRLQISRFGAAKTLTNTQRETAAKAFSAKADRLDARKRLVLRTDRCLRRCNTIVNLAQKLWRAWTGPYPIEGIRLLPKAKVTFLNEKLEQCVAMLEPARKALDASKEAILAAARTDLVDLFSEGDYPESMGDKFAIQWDYPALNPENSLRQLSRDLYESERLKAHARFEEAVALTHAAVVKEFTTLVDYLIDRLSDDPIKGPKKFADKKLDSIGEFFDRAQALSIGSSPLLDKLIEDAKLLVGGVDPKALRSDALLRGSIATGMSQLKEQLAPLIVEGDERGIVI